MKPETEAAASIEIGQKMHKTNYKIYISNINTYSNGYSNYFHKQDPFKQKHYFIFYPS